jgi:hypothetical protein
MGISNAAKVDATILNPAVFQALQSTQTSSATPNCIQVSLQSQKYESPNTKSTSKT